MKATLLITGIAGFIGSKIAAKAIEKGYTVIGVDDLSNGKKENIPSIINFYELDLTNKELLSQLPHNIDYILHLAGQSSGEISFDNPILDLERNTHSTLNLIQFGIARKIKKIFYASSMSVYGSVKDEPISETHEAKPLSCYGVGKRASEQYLTIFKQQLPFVNFRMFNVYGPGQDLQNMRQGMVSIFLSQALQNNLIIVKGSLERFRDFIYIDDVVDCWLNAVEKKAIKNITFNLGSGERTSVGDLVTEISKHFECTKLQNEGNTPGDQYGIYSNNVLLKKYFLIDKLKPLEEGIKEFVYWAKLKKI
jgi:UDP-glucose 4-epimerase